MKERELLPCSIGTADLVAEFVDELFDDCEFIDKHGMIIGFINGEPVHLVVRYTTNRIKVVFGDPMNVFMRVHDLLKECDKENPDSEYRHIAKGNGNEITIWYVPINK